MACSLLWIGCSKEDATISTIGRTKIALQEQADRWDTSDSTYARSYLAPMFRNAVPRLEEGGADALPLLLTATLAHNLDVPQNITGWSYCFCWLQIGDGVRGFYVRSEGKPDCDIYPTLNKRPQVPGTAWMVAGGPIILGKIEDSQSQASSSQQAVLLDSSVLAQDELRAGLILADGRKTVPIRVFKLEGNAADVLQRK